MTTRFHGPTGRVNLRKEEEFPPPEPPDYARQLAVLPTDITGLTLFVEVDRQFYVNDYGEAWPTVVLLNHTHAGPPLLMVSPEPGLRGIPPREMHAYVPRHRQ